MRGANSVGIVRIDDVIYDVRKTLDIIDHYLKDDNLRAIVVRVDSPGGAVGSAQEVFEAVKRLGASGKKVVASLGNMAASGGYYVACGAPEIYSNPGTLTGSIGVILGVLNIEEINKRLGVQYTSVKSGKFKDIGSMARPMTDEEKGLLQNVIDDTYNQFLDAILSQRRQRIAKAIETIGKSDPAVARTIAPHRTPEALLRAIADGRIFSGRQALAYGLVDKIGTENDALKRAGQLAGIARPEPYEYKPRRTLRDFLEAGAKSAIANATFPLRAFRLEYRMP
jgi:protease-4